MNYLVIGATGNVGGEVTTQLLTQGQTVRALVRDPSSAEKPPTGVDPTGVEVAVGDLDDVESLTAATRGIDGVFFMQVDPATTQTEYMVKAARANDVSKIVVLSSIGTRLQPQPMIGARIAARDQVLEETGLDAMPVT